MRPTDFPHAQRSSRLAGAAGALLLQGGFLLLFLASMPKFAPPVTPGRELTLALPRLRQTPPPPPVPARGVPRPSVPALAAPPQMAAPAPAILPPPAAVPGLQNFGQALNGCAPEQYQSLTPDQRARCPRPGEGVAIQEEPNLMGTRSQVKDEAHWQEEWARKTSPALLPCGGFTNLLCLLSKIADGSMGDYADPSRWPHYEVKQLAPGDFYKVEQAYDEWHKAHPGSLPQDAHATR